MLKIHIAYDPIHGVPYADGTCWSLWSSLLAGCSTADSAVIDIHTSTSNMVNALRVLIKRGTVSHEDVTILYKRPDGVPEMLIADKDGRLDHWPDGFCDFDEKVYDELIDWSVKA